MAVPVSAAVVVDVAADGVCAGEVGVVPMAAAAAMIVATSAAEIATIAVAAAAPAAAGPDVGGADWGSNAAAVTPLPA